jgi:hypothetical protein
VSNRLARLWRGYLTSLSMRSLVRHPERNSILLLGLPLRGRQHGHERPMGRAVLLDDWEISLVAPMAIGDAVLVENLAYILVPPEHYVLRNPGIDAKLSAIQGQLVLLRHFDCWQHAFRKDFFCVIPVCNVPHVVDSRRQQIFVV